MLPEDKEADHSLSCGSGASTSPYSFMENLIIHRDDFALFLLFFYN
jgi:hypothetical protein